MNKNHGVLKTASDVVHSDYVNCILSVFVGGGWIVWDHKSNILKGGVDILNTYCGYNVHLGFCIVWYKGRLVFTSPVVCNTKYPYDEKVNLMFLFGHEAFSAIWKVYKAIGYLLSVEFYWWAFLSEFIVAIYSKARWVHDGLIFYSHKVIRLYYWCLLMWLHRYSDAYWWAVYIINQVQAVVLHHV